MAAGALDFFTGRKATVEETEKGAIRSPRKQVPEINDQRDNVDAEAGCDRDQTTLSITVQRSNRGSRY